MTDCMFLPNKRKEDGYVRICRNGKRIYAHRYAYEIVKGEVPADKELDHLCNERACVNIEHLEVVDHKTNMERSRNTVLKTGYCRNGHELKEGDIYIHPAKGPTCRLCKRSSLNKWRRRNKMR